MACLVCRMLVVLITTLCGFGVGAALANGPSAKPDDTSCDAELFAGYIPTFQSRDTLPREGVFAIALQPVAEVIFFVRSNDGARTGYGGIVTFESLIVGRYAITLSQAAHLEAVHQRSFQAIPVTRRNDDTDCSVTSEIAVDGGPLSLQLSGVAIPSIMVAVTRLPE